MQMKTFVKEIPDAYTHTYLIKLKAFSSPTKIECL